MMHIRQPMVKPYPTSAQEIIEKWMADGLSKKEAVARFEGITHCILPESIFYTIKEKI